MFNMNNNFLPTNQSSKRKLTEQQETFLSALATTAKGDINLALQEAGYQLTSKSKVVVAIAWPSLT